jgi:hypothetical protein
MDLDDLVTFCAHPSKLLPWLGEDAADDAAGATYAPGTGTAAESTAPANAYAIPGALPTPLGAAVPLHEHEVVSGAWRELTTSLRFGRVQVPCDVTRDAANDGTGGVQQPGGWQQVLDVRWVAAQGRVLVALADVACAARKGAGKAELLAAAWSGLSADSAASAVSACISYATLPEVISWASASISS